MPPEPPAVYEPGAVSAARVSRSPASSASAAGQASSATRSRSRTATSRVGGASSAVPPALLVVEVVVGATGSSSTTTANPSRTPTASSAERGTRPANSASSTSSGASAASSGRSAASGSISSSARAGWPSRVGQRERRESLRRAPRLGDQREHGLGQRLPGPGRPRRRPPTGRRRRRAPGARAARPGRRGRRRAGSSNGCTASRWATCRPGSPSAARRSAPSSAPGSSTVAGPAPCGRRPAGRAARAARRRARARVREGFERRVQRPPPLRRPLDPEQPLHQLGERHPVHAELGQHRGGGAGRRRSQQPVEPGLGEQPGQR